MSFIGRLEACVMISKFLAGGLNFFCDNPNRIKKKTVCGAVNLGTSALMYTGSCDGVLSLQTNDLFIVH